MYYDLCLISSPKNLKHNNKHQRFKQLIVDFMYETFINNSILQQSVKIELAIDSLDALTILTNIHDIATLRKVIDISCVIYRLLFQYVVINDNSNQI